MQYFGPSFSYHLSLRSLFCIFLSGHFTQALLYSAQTFAYQTKHNLLDVAVTMRKTTHLLCPNIISGCSTKHEGNYTPTVSKHNLLDVAVTMRKTTHLLGPT